MSMKPGATMRPCASMTRLGRGVGENANLRDAAVDDADVAGIPGEPVPSMMWPLRMTRSKVCAAGKGDASTARIRTARNLGVKQELYERL